MSGQRRKRTPYEIMRGEIRAGVHPVILMIRYNLTVHDLCTEVCFLAGVTPPWPPDIDVHYQTWLPYFATRSYM